jgi:hypothetical protein
MAGRGFPLVEADSWCGEFRGKPNYGSDPTGQPLNKRSALGHDRGMAENRLRGEILRPPAVGA